MLDAPQWAFTLVGGVLADHADRRRVIAGFQALQMLCPLALVVLIATGAISPWMVVALAFVVGTTDALSMPSFSSIVPSIVEREQIPAGLALSSIQFNLSRILGPALAGALLAGAGLIACFAVNAASYVPFIAIAFWILPRGRAAASGFDRKHPLAGMRATLTDRRLRGALLTVLATGLFSGPLITFMPVLVRLEMHGGSGVFSATIAAFGVGGLLGAGGVLATDPARDHRARSSWLAIALGALVVVAGFAPWLWTLPVIGAAAGAAMTSSNTLANAVIQQTSHDDLRGQAVSMYMLAMRGGAALGSLATGIGIPAFGIRGALVIDGTIAIILQLAIWRANGLREPATPPRGMR
jgi:MFS family permease